MRTLWLLIALATAAAAIPAFGQRGPAPLSWSAAQDRLGPLFDRADTDDDARLSRQELFSLRRLYRPALEDGGLPALDARIWGYFDEDRDGYVTRQELLSGARARFDQVDSNSDGTVTYRERHDAQEHAFKGACDGLSPCRAPDRRTGHDAASGLERFSPSTTASFRHNSGLREARYEAIRDPGSWENLWSSITTRGGPAPLFPQVDFDRDMVLVAAMGQRATGGYSIHIASVRPQGADLVVDVIRTSPGRRCGTTQALTQPADLVKVPASSRRIRWRFQDRVTDCP